MSSGFISETDLAERRRVKKEIWQTTRGENDPEEPPEDPETLPDHRSLYERLQEQKLKKQEDWEESHKLKNMVRGLEDDEVDFLEMVDNTKLQQEKRIKEEEDSVLKEYRKKVSEIQQKSVESVVLAELKSDGKKSSMNRVKKSQLSLVAGAIKRKNSETDIENKKKANTFNDESASITSTSKDTSTNLKESKETDKSLNVKKSQSALECVAILPGLGNYTDSSDSDNDSNSDISDIESHVHQYIPRDITGKP